jgi:hypothetical protein
VDRTLDRFRKIRRDPRRRVVALRRLSVQRSHPDRRDGDMAREAQAIRVAGQADVGAVAGVDAAVSVISSSNAATPGGRSAEPTVSGLTFWSSAKPLRFRSDLAAAR